MEQLERRFQKNRYPDYFEYEEMADSVGLSKIEVSFIIFVNEIYTLSLFTQNIYCYRWKFGLKTVESSTKTK